MLHQGGKLTGCSMYGETLSKPSAVTQADPNYTDTAYLTIMAMKQFASVCRASRYPF
jgi:hypothetical protein